MRLVWETLKRCATREAKSQANPAFALATWLAGFQDVEITHEVCKRGQTGV
jgi:hypothetical protein